MKRGDVREAGAFRQRARRELLAYFGLAYAVTWLGLSPLVAAHLGIIGPVPGWLHAAGALGPIAAAVIVTRRTRGAAAARRLLSRTFREPPAAGWLLVSAGSPLLLLMLAAAGMALLGPGAGASPLAWGKLGQAAARPDWWAHLLIACVCYGFGEEPGWRGFALPRLQERFSAWRASLLLCIGWGLWHLPMFFYRFSFEGAGTVIGFFVSLAAGAFWLTFLYNSTGGSVLAVALWHTVWNAANLTAAVLSPELVATLNALMMLAGFAILLTGPRELSLSGGRVSGEESQPAPLAATATLRNRTPLP
jgi:membrane protease YdiL (CAAX protease family)